MRTFVQIIAILTFLLAGSQFTHGHETASANPHVHAHQTHAHSNQAMHIDIADTHVEHNDTVHCGAHLLSLAAAPGFFYPPHIQYFSNWRSDRQRLGQISFELPPPRA